nr:hypothetical protein [Saprospiraceae bacterium]
MFIANIYIYIYICATLNAQSFENYVDSMMNSTEGIAMYEEMMVEMPPHIDSLDWVEYIDTYMWFYYGHEFYELFYPEIYQTAVDSLNPGMCYNGTFQESSLSDDHVKGFKLYAGLAPNDEYCVFDHSKLMNLPLPENSTPDDPLFPFNLNPFDNENTTQFPGYKSFSSVELFLEGSGPDELTGLINSNPPSGNRSIRLNRGDFGFSGFGMSVTMERSFIVEEENSLFTIGFSFIGSHREVDTFDFVFLLDNYRPSFTIVLLDENDLVINQRCFSMHHNESDFEFVFQGGQFGSFIFRDWALIKEDLSNHIDEKVTLRIVSSHAPFNTKRDMGYGYLSDI